VTAVVVTAVVVTAVAAATVVTAVAVTEVVRTEPHGRPPAPGDRRLSVVIPAYREGERITAAIERVRAELAPHVAPDELEIVVVDDGSGDGTAEAAAGADLVLTHGVNRGKGAAVRTGMLAAGGRTRVFTDADLSYAPAQIARLVELVEAGWDVVVGNRHHEQTTTTVATSALREVGGRVVNGATRLVLRQRHTDTQCGLKAFRSDVADLVFSLTRVDGFAFDVEIFMLADRYDLALLEVPVELENSGRSTVRVVRDASVLLVDLARIRADLARGHYRADPDLLAGLAPGSPRAIH
jgi:glycosyltransferase involved in cell wall biosynthesis